MLTLKLMRNIILYDMIEYIIVCTNIAIVEIVSRIVYSGSCRCALIGVPCRLSMLSTFSTFANVLF